MSKKIIVCDLGEGKTFCIEAVDGVPAKIQNKVDAVGVERVEYLKKWQEFDDVIGVIKPIAEKFIKPLRSMEDQPENIEVQFQFKFDADSKVMLTANEAEAIFKVTLNWGKQKKIKKD